MTLKTLLYNIAQYAIGNKIINYSAAGPSLYQLNMETIKDYPVLFASPTGNHNITPNLTTYTITLYYIDRLTRGGDNDIDILSTSVEGLKSIINGIKYLPGVIEIYDDYNITNFADTQKMSDNVAGAYATITIRTANNSTCPDGGIISNGSFIPSDNIVVKNQNKNLIVNENGNYTLKPDNGYTGLGRVIVKVDVPDDNGSYEEGYEEGNRTGIEAGKRIQKELMQPITITSNGTYIREDGYSEVVVDVDGDENRYDEGYQDGYSQGEEDQKAKLTNITIRENGTYTSKDGYGEVIVNVEGSSGGDCEEAYEQGKADQKALMTTATFTRNGTYTREDGYSTVVVDVADENGNYQDGYDTGIEEGKITGYNSGYTAGETAQKSKLTGITITENGTYLKDDGYNEVIVNVPQTGGTTGSLVLVDGTKLSYSTFTEVPDYYDLSNITDVSYMFSGCENLKSIPQLDTSNSTNMKYMFSHCENLQKVPELDTSNVTNMERMFYDCPYLKSIPQLDTSNVTNMSNMFGYCISLTTIPQLDTSKVTNMGWMFASSYNLQSLPTFDVSNVTNMDEMFRNTMKYLTNVGGWINLSCNWDGSSGLKVCPNLTYQSCINILNGLADVTELGGRTLKVHSNFLTTVGDEISIGINKGWTITA